MVKEKLPEYNELTQYVIEENGLLVVKDLEQVNEPTVEPEPYESEPYEPAPTTEEILDDLISLLVEKGVIF